MNGELLLAWISLGFAVLPLGSYWRHGRLFAPPRRKLDANMMPGISVLIPARNEEGSIRAALDSILQSVGVEVEVVVLDDHSTDATREIIREVSHADPRVRLMVSPPLPAGWSGKQHACFTLATAASHEIITFLDADVRLAPDALARLAQFRHDSAAALVSGFPRQETVTVAERLILPLINWLLVCYLPLGSARRSLAPSLGAGCGQWFLTTRSAYNQAGGHAAIRTSYHDGVKLPRAYRRAGLMTDVCDATDLAVCRMYQSAGAVWNGLAKNAREGLGGPVGIWVWSLLLLTGHLLPFVLVAVLVGDGVSLALVVAVVACGCSLLPRLLCAARFRQSWWGAVLHPLGVLLLVLIQWYATIRVWIGRPVGWKGRPRPTSATI